MLLSKNKSLFVTPKSGVSLHKNNSADSKILYIIPFNSKINLIEQKVYINDMVTVKGIPGNWIKVQYGNKLGYVFDGFLSEIKIDERVPIVGEYIMVTDLTKYNPSQLFIYKDKTFKYYINLCHGFGIVRGTYHVDGKTIKLKIKSSDFNIAKKDKVELVFQIDKNYLRLQAVIPDESIGCDFMPETLFIKK